MFYLFYIKVYQQTSKLYQNSELDNILFEIANCSFEETNTHQDDESLIEEVVVNFELEYIELTYTYYIWFFIFIIKDHHQKDQKDKDSEVDKLQFDISISLSQETNSLKNEESFTESCETTMVRKNTILLSLLEPILIKCCCFLRNLSQRKSTTIPIIEAPTSK